MNSTARFVCYLIALILFVIEAIRTKSLVAAGLAVWVLVPTWDSLEAL